MEMLKEGPAVCACGCCDDVDDDGCCENEHDEGRSIRIGSYSLPVKRLAVFGAALGLWIIGFLLMKLGPGAGYLRFLPLAPLAASYALAGLKRVRLVKARRDGRIIYYSLDDDHVNSIVKFAREHLGEHDHGNA
jgi:DNA-binding transcriptional ArsR family regulator